MKLHHILGVFLVASILAVGAASAVKGGGAPPVDPGVAAAVGRVLDDFHDAASKADEARYFGHFAENAVFIGTDALERWGMSEFREYAHPYFAKGKGWTYRLRPGTRHVDAAENVAWFDEMLDNDKYGLCRGTGVMVLQGGKWRIVQYHLTLPIPNEMMGEISAKVKAWQTEGP